MRSLTIAIILVLAVIYYWLETKKKKHKRF